MQGGVILTRRRRGAAERACGFMTQQDESELRAQLSRLKQEHRDLDAAIAALEAMAGFDRIQVQRLKKRKLMIKDRISEIEDQLFPDIIA